MNARLLIDQIVRQTTILIAQISTASGIRAPLAHIADQIFLQLALEIEGQGVSRKVAADMFGMAIRSYQRKVQRLVEDTVPGTTLWHSVLAFLDEQGPATRAALLERFRHKDESVVLAIANDLVGLGLAYRSGRGEASVVGLVPAADVQRVLEREEAASLEAFSWLAVFREQGIREQALLERFGESDQAKRALTALLADGRVQRVDRDGAVVLETGPFYVAVGSPKGWEAAVFDHFQAVTTAIASKLRAVGPQSAASDLTGGTTVHFGIHDAHPYRDEVLGTLARTRLVLDALLAQVTEENRKHPVPEDQRTRVTFYFGQHVIAPDAPEPSVEPIAVEQESP